MIDLENISKSLETTQDVKITKVKHFPQRSTNCRCYSDAKREIMKMPPRLITQEAAEEELKTYALICAPTDKKRFIVPAFGFSGAVKTQRPEYLPPDYNMVMQDVDGLEFYNPKDQAKQVLKQADGCLICYDAPGLKEKVDGYIKQHPDAFKTAAGVKGVIDFLKQHAIDPNTGKPDVYDTDVAFAQNLIGAPEHPLSPGETFVGAKKKETVQAFFVHPGDKFAGPTGTPQIAGKGGAFVVKDSAGMRMVQADVFHQAYALVTRSYNPRIHFNRANNTR